MEDMDILFTALECSDVQVRHDTFKKLKEAH